MSALGDRVAAWWSAWQWVVILAVLCVLLAGLNVWQWKRAITAPLRAEVASKDRALDLSEALLRDTTARAAALDAAADKAAAALGRAGKDYRAAARARPLTSPICAPGQDRVDAVNRALGASLTPEKP